MKKLAPLLALLCFLASLIMYQVGSSSGHLRELKDMFWLPLPLGVIFALLALKNKNSS